MCDAGLRVSVRDENKRPEEQMLLNKGVSVANSKVPLAQVNQNRRALGDIGNLVGALSARCIVSKDGVQQQQENPPKPVADHKARIDRPITRKFGANLSNIIQIPSQSLVPQQAALLGVNEAPQGEALVPWRTKQRRTMAQQAAGQTVRTAVHHTAESTALPPLLGQPRTRVASNRGAVALLNKKQTLTAILTARSEAASGGFEVEMEEAEDILPNIDEGDVGNQLAVVDYVEDIYCFYRKAEIHSCVAPDYMSRQVDINEKMRSILIDWLIEVHLKFKLMPETLFLTMNLIDRYLACRNVLRKNLQLVGVTAMLLASKYEEIWAPEVRDFVFITDSAYTEQQVLEMEKSMLNKLKFNLTVPTPYVFLVRFLKAAAADTQVEMMAFFLTELCLTEYSMIKYSPSLLAAAAVYTAQQTLRRFPSWNTVLQRHSGYMEMHLRDCASNMVNFHRMAKDGHLKVVYRKYSSPDFKSVASLEPAAFS